MLVCLVLVLSRVFWLQFSSIYLYPAVTLCLNLNFFGLLYNVFAVTYKHIGNKERKRIYSLDDDETANTVTTLHTGTL